MLSTNEFVNFIFSTALFINALLFIPQAIHIIKNKTAAGLSLFTFLGFFLIQLAVVLHAVIVKDYLLLIGYLLSMLTCGTVVSLILVHKRPKKDSDITEISLQEVFEQLPGHVYGKGKSGIFAFSNRNNWYDFGLKSLSDFKGKTDYDLFSKEEADQLRMIDEEVVKTGQFKVIEEKLTKFDGETVLYLSHKTPLKNKENKIIGLIGVSLDITTAKQEIEDRLNMLENIIAVMPGNVYWMNSEGVYLGCNDNEAKAVGLSSRKEIIGKRNVDIPGFVIPEVLDPINKQVIEEGKMLMLEEPAILADGTKATFLSSKVPLYNDRSEIVGMVGISLDITKEKEIQKSLKKANQARLEFVSMASHEIRNPVSSVVSLARSLQENLKTLQDLVDVNKLDAGRAVQNIIDKVIEQCDDIHTEAERSLTSLKNLSDFHLMQLHGVKVFLEKCKVAHILEVAIKRSVYLNKNNIKVIQSINPSMLETIVTDVENIIMALTIVLGNAFRFSHPGGEVKINVQDIEKDGCKAMVIAVQDFGVGMHEEQIRNLSLNLLDFNAEREFVYHKPSVQLSRAKMYIEAFNGSLAIESRLDKGTIVKLTTNYRLPEPSSEKEKLMLANSVDLVMPNIQKAILRAVDKPICSVLLVEDDHTTRYITYTKLAELGCKVDVAANGTEAVKMLTENDYDIALLDITLPDINGLEVMRQIRKIKEDKIIFVAISSHSSPEDEEYMLTQGMIALIAKPVTEQQLKRVIDMVLDFKEEK